MSMDTYHQGLQQAGWPSDHVCRYRYLPIVLFGYCTQRESTSVLHRVGKCSRGPSSSSLGSIPEDTLTISPGVLLAAGACSSNADGLTLPWHILGIAGRQYWLSDGSDLSQTHVDARTSRQARYAPPKLDKPQPGKSDAVGRPLLMLSCILRCISDQHR